jgi:hypothetical protein
VDVYLVLLLVLLNLVLIAFLADLVLGVFARGLSGMAHGIEKLLKLAGAVAIVVLDVALAMTPEVINAPPDPFAITHATCRTLMATLASARLADADVTKIATALRGRVVDGWGQLLAIEISRREDGQAEIRAVSPGRDRQLGTSDDVLHSIVL